MPSVKIHVKRGANDGTESCDFRGDKFIGSPEDEHRTVLEIDPANETLVATVLEMGPEINAVFKQFTQVQPDGIEKVADALGLKGSGPVGLRIGIFDQ